MNLNKDKKREYKTPYYIIDVEKLEKNLENLKVAFDKVLKKNVIYSYSFKTNSLPWILDWFNKKGIYAEVVSEDEYNLAIKLGYKKENIIFNGPIKGYTALGDALNNSSIVNLDSFHEIEWIKENIKNKKNSVWKVGLRINFDLEKYCPHETIMGEEVGRFGFNIESGDLNKAIAELEKIRGVKIVGLHGHNSTKTKSLKIFKEISKKMVEVSDLIENKLEYLDIGGCFFGDKKGAPTFEEYAEVIKKEIHKKYLNNITLILEPGAALIASPISYITKIIDKKIVREDVILTSDGSLHHLNPAMTGVNFGVEYDSVSEKIDKQIIAGYTCIEKDRLGTIKNKNRIEIGTTIKINNVGAYSMALSPLFIQYFPDVYVKENNKMYLARRRWTVEEYMQNNFIGNEIEK